MLRKYDLANARKLANNLAKYRTMLQMRIISQIIANYLQKVRVVWGANLSGKRTGYLISCLTAGFFRCVLVLSLYFRFKETAILSNRIFQENSNEVF